ncbi:MAG: N-acetylneuraminate synthase family protein [Acutalibacteraceae bacterium]|nr:N-acetylneuraminate synthase family protein [Clostridiales bacterium]
MVNGCTEITLLHCNKRYSTPYEDVKLMAMNTYLK